MLTTFSAMLKHLKAFPLSRFLRSGPDSPFAIIKKNPLPIWCLAIVPHKLNSDDFNDQNYLNLAFLLLNPVHPPLETMALKSPSYLFML